MKQWFVSGLLAVTIGSAQAATIILENGDRLSGEIVFMQGDILRFNSTYAGELDIPWEIVTGFTTDEPIVTELVNNSRVNGVAVESEPGKVRIEGDDVLDTVAFDVSKVKAINPPTTEELEAKLKPALELEGFVNIGLSATTGNSDTRQYNLSGEFNARSEKSRYTIGANFNRGDADGETTVDNWSVYTNYDYFLSERVFWNNSLTLQQNDLQLLDLRTAISTGIGYQFYDQDDLSLSATVGVGYLSENFALQDTQQSIAGRWSVDYDHKWLEWLRFFHNHEGLVSVEDVNDFVIRSQTGVRYPIAGRLTGNIQVNFNYDNSPSPGTEKEDFIYILGLGYLWE